MLNACSRRQSELNVQCSPTACSRSIGVYAAPVSPLLFLLSDLVCNTVQLNLPGHEKSKIMPTPPTPASRPASAKPSADAMSLIKGRRYTWSEIVDKTGADGSPPYYLLHRD